MIWIFFYLQALFLTKAYNGVCTDKSRFSLSFFYWINISTRYTRAQINMSLFELRDRYHDFKLYFELWNMSDVIGGAKYHHYMI